MMQAVAKREKIQTLGDAVKTMMTKVPAVIAKHFTPEKMAQLAQIAASRNPLLLECTTASMLKSLITAGQLGLDPCGTLGSAYLVPFKNKRGFREAQLIPGYRGLMDLARRSGEVSHIEARVVMDGDLFDYAYGLKNKLEHLPSRENGDKITHAYAIARLSNGESIFEVMTKKQLDGIRNRSRAGQSGPWVTDYAEMCRKTVVRRLCKYLPMTPDLSRAIELDGDAETAGQITEIDFLIPDEQPPEQSKSDQLADKLKPVEEAKIEGIPPMGQQFYCPGCKMTFDSLEALKAHHPCPASSSQRATGPRGRKRELMQKLGIPFRHFRSFSTIKLEKMAAEKQPEAPADATEQHQEANEPDEATLPTTEAPAALPDAKQTLIRAIKDAPVSKEQLTIAIGKVIGNDQPSLLYLSDSLTEFTKDELERILAELSRMIDKE